MVHCVNNGFFIKIEKFSLPVGFLALFLPLTMNWCQNVWESRSFKRWQGHFGWSSNFAFCVWWRFFTEILQMQVLILLVSASSLMCFSSLHLVPLLCNFKSDFSHLAVRWRRQKEESSAQSWEMNTSPGWTWANLLQCAISSLPPFASRSMRRIF